MMLLQQELSLPIPQVLNSFKEVTCTYARITAY